MSEEETREPRVDRRFPQRKRVKLQRDFQRVYAFRARAYNARLVFCCVPTDPSASARLGLSVSKKVGNACVRNRWKRLIREAFRLLADEIPQGCDYVAIPQKGVAPPTFETVQSDVRELTKRAAKKAFRKLDPPALLEATTENSVDASPDVAEGAP